MSKQKLFLLIMMLLAVALVLFAWSEEVNTEFAPITMTFDSEWWELVQVVEESNGKTVLIPHDAEAFIQQTGLEKPMDGAQLIKIIRVKTDADVNQNPTARRSFNLLTRAVPYETVEGTLWQRLARERMMCSIPSGCNALTLSFNVPFDLLTTFHADVAVSETVVGDGVGFPIGISRDILIKASVTEAIGYNESFIIEAYPRVALTSFAVEKRMWPTFSWEVAGSGFAWQALPHEVDLVVWKTALGEQ